MGKPLAYALQALVCPEDFSVLYCSAQLLIMLITLSHCINRDSFCCKWQSPMKSGLSKKGNLLALNSEKGSDKPGFGFCWVQVFYLYFQRYLSSLYLFSVFCVGFILGQVLLIQWQGDGYQEVQAYILPLQLSKWKKNVLDVSLNHTPKGDCMIVLGPIWVIGQSLNQSPWF